VVSGLLVRPIAFDAGGRNHTEDPDAEKALMAENCTSDRT
jgi:hypothetical protein